MTFEGRVSTVVTLYAQLTRDLSAIAEFLVSRQKSCVLTWKSGINLWATLHVHKVKMTWLTRDK